MDRHAQGTAASPSPSTVLVGLKLTPDSRELLTWTIASLTKPRDQVIGIHILPSSTHTEYAGEELDSTIKEQLDNTFEAVLGVYQGLCTLKQLQLDIKVIAGLNLKEGLVETAKMERATKLILGSDGPHTLRRTHALAKYCVQKLPPSCSVLVIEHGDINFNKPGTLELQGKQTAGDVLRRSMRRFKGGSHKKSPLAIAKSPSHKSHDWSTPRCLLADSNPCLYKSSATDKYHPDSPVSVLCCNPNEKFHQPYPSDQKVACFDQKTSDADSEVASQRNAEDVIRNPECSTQPGWPLMHHCISLEKVTTSDADARHLSVVKWALQLPSRPVLPSHPPLNGEYGSSPLTDRMHRFHDGHRSLLRGLSLRDALDSGVTTECSKYGEIDAFQPRLSGDATIQSRFSEDKEKECLDTDQYHHRNPLLAEKLDSLCMNTSCSSYSYEELEEATSYFSPRNIIGQGGCSQVYRGTLRGGRKVAVKRIKEGSTDAENELLTEVEILSTLRHRYIIPLLGFCVDSRRFLLVYNLAERGNLDENLHGYSGGEERPTLEWAARHRIAVGAAHALQYLHAGCPCPVVHRDIKSSNILLTSDFQPQISDFGLAKWAPLSSSFDTCNDVFGTFGYLAPEYFMFGKVNEKTDVYSFGVVLLELITGKQPVDISKPKGQENLVVWARTLLEGGHFEQLIDPKLKNYDIEEMKHMIVVAALCIRQSPRNRPRMSQVLKFLSMEDDRCMSTMKHLLDTIRIEGDEHFSKDGLNGTEFCPVRPYLPLTFKVDDDDEVASECSIDRSYHSLVNLNPTHSLEEYFDNRYSRSSSFE